MSEEEEQFNVTYAYLDETYDNAFNFKIVERRNGELHFTEPFKKSFLKTQERLEKEGHPVESIRISRLFNEIIYNYLGKESELSEEEKEDLARFCFLCLEGVSATTLAITRRQWGR